jgi:hypothetical protein
VQVYVPRIHTTNFWRRHFLGDAQKLFPSNASAQIKVTHWYLPDAKAFRLRRIISEKRHYEPRARELVCGELIGIHSVTRTARCCIRKELL